MALADRLGEQDAVDAPGRRPGDDVGQHADIGMGRQLVEQLDIDLLAVLRGEHRHAGAQLAAQRGAVQLPNLLGDAVHIDGKADPAVADQREAKFLVAHVGLPVPV